MRKKVRRALDRLRGLTNGWLRGETSVRGGLQEPQRLRALLVPARIPPRMDRVRAAIISTYPPRGHSGFVSIRGVFESPGLHAVASRDRVRVRCSR
jgi:hypothetical protein